MNKHTSAPWRIRGNEIGKRIESDTQSHGMLAIIATVDMYDFPEEAEANKFLIASAPALLQALENYIIANRELDIAECQKSSEIRQKRSNLQMAEQSAIAAIAAARGDV